MSQQINLCNPLFRKQKKYFSALAMVQTLGLVILSSLLFGAWLTYQTHRLQQQAEQVSQLQDRARTQMTTLGLQVNARKPSPALLDQIIQTEQSVQDEQFILHLLAQGELGNQNGFSNYFIALSQHTVPGLWLTGFEIIATGEQISLRGMALTPELVAQFIDQLKTANAFTGMDFSTLTIQHPSAQATEDSPSAPQQHPHDLPYIEFTLSKLSTEKLSVPPLVRPAQ